MKKVKDFTEEEKAAILARAEKIELPRVAKEFNTTWQVVSAIQRSAKNTKNKKSKAAKVDKVKKNAAADKTARRSNDERRLAILKRASEVGVVAAAAEAGVSKWTVFQWRKLMKKAGYSVPRAAKVSKKAVAVASTPKPEAAEAVKTRTVTSAVNAKTSYSNIEFENEMLKQKLASLNEQVAKLRAALSALA